MEKLQKEKDKKISLPLHGNKLISFDTIELVTRKNNKIIKIKDIKKSIQKKKNIKRS